MVPDPDLYPEPVFLTFMEHRNRFQGIISASLRSLAGRYDNPIPTRCLAPIDFLKIPALLVSPLTFKTRPQRRNYLFLGSSADYILKIHFYKIKSHKEVTKQ
jgi:hypothetical protein